MKKEVGMKKEKLDVRVSKLFEILGIEIVDGQYSSMEKKDKETR